MLSRSSISSKVFTQVNYCAGAVSWKVVLGYREDTKSYSLGTQISSAVFLAVNSYNSLSFDSCSSFYCYSFACCFCTFLSSSFCCTFLTLSLKAWCDYVSLARAIVFLKTISQATSLNSLRNFMFSQVSATRFLQAWSASGCFQKMSLSNSVTI